MTIAANPKAAVFAFSFFPQFLPRHGPVLGTAVALAAIQVVIIDGPYCAMVVLLASRARNWLSRAAIRRRSVPPGNGRHLGSGPGRDLIGGPHDVPEHEQRENCPRR